MLPAVQGSRVTKQQQQHGKGKKKRRLRTFRLLALSRTEASCAAPAASLDLAGGGAALFFCTANSRDTAGSVGAARQVHAFGKTLSEMFFLLHKREKGEAAAQLLNAQRHVRGAAEELRF